MKKELRIKKSDEIELVMKSGVSKANRTFIVYKLKNTNNPKYRVAISASKKLGNAVARNKVKRQIRSLLHQNDDLLQNGHDYFVISRPDLLLIDFETATKQIRHILGLVNQPSKGNNNKQTKIKNKNK